MYETYKKKSTKAQAVFACGGFAASKQALALAHKTIHHSLFAALIKGDVQLMSVDIQNHAVAEFVVGDAVSAAKNGAIRALGFALVNGGPDGGRFGFGGKSAGVPMA